jgi:hypothetical protein
VLDFGGGHGGHAVLIGTGGKGLGSLGTGGTRGLLIGKNGLS